jgi:hypothetical protein
MRFFASLRCSWLRVEVGGHAGGVRRCCSEKDEEGRRGAGGRSRGGVLHQLETMIECLLTS